MNAHRLAEERSLAYHREVVEVLRADPSRLHVARGNVTRWRDAGTLHPHYADAWGGLLDGPLEDLLAVLVDQSETARALRQCTPFAGFLDPRRRWEIWREVRERWERSA